MDSILALISFQLSSIRSSRAVCYLATRGIVFVKILNSASFCFPFPLVVLSRVLRCPSFFTQVNGCWFGLLWCLQTSPELCTTQGHSLLPPLTWHKWQLLSIPWALGFWLFPSFAEGELSSLFSILFGKRWFDTVERAFVEPLVAEASCVCGTDVPPSGP